MGVQVCPAHSDPLQSYWWFWPLQLCGSHRFYGGIYRSLEASGASFRLCLLGFLGSTRQIHIVADFIDYFGTPDNLVVVDPVMRITAPLQLHDRRDHPSDEGADCQGRYHYPLTSHRSRLFIGRILQRQDQRWRNQAVVAPSQRDGAGCCHHHQCSGGTVFRQHQCSGLWQKKSRLLEGGMPVHSASYPGTGDAFASVVIGSLLQGRQSARRHWPGCSVYLPVHQSELWFWLSQTQRCSSGKGARYSKDAGAHQRVWDAVIIHSTIQI